MQSRAASSGSISKTNSVSRTARQPSAAPGELVLLQSIRHRASATVSSALRMGIGDDCALIRVRAGEEFAVTTDLSIQGRHFQLDWHPPESIGHRTMARGLSDLAAMGARPVAAFLSLGLPRSLTLPADADSETGPALGTSWTARFLDGLLALAAQHRVPLAGGDLAESPLAVADIVLTGAVPAGQALLRSTARPGDRLFITGTLGGAAAELAAIANSAAQFAAFTTSRPGSPHLYPQPRIAQGLFLRKRGLASAALDLSDGLSTDLAHLCQESGVSAEVLASAIPLGLGATLEMALHGGEDYELLFAAPSSAKIPRSIAGVKITQIGRLTRLASGTPQVALLTESGPQPLEPKGWQHFTGE